jgi:hypothetical protein
MNFDAYEGFSRPHFEQRKFASLPAQQQSVAFSAAQSALENKSYVLAAQRAAEYRKKMLDKQEGEQERSGIFGAIGTGLGAVAGSFFGAPQVGAVIGGSIGRSIA